MPAPTTGDSGTLTLRLQSNNPIGNPVQITFQHAVLVGGAICNWNIQGGFAALTGSPVPDSVTVVISPPATVPVLGAGMLSLLAALLMLVAIRRVRKLSQN